MQLKREGVLPIHGLNLKDAPEDAATWLDELGDPYTRTGADRDGRVAIEWGVYGVPETFRSEEHTSGLQSLMRISYAVFCLKKKRKDKKNTEEDRRHMHD